MIMCVCNDVIMCVIMWINDINNDNININVCNVMCNNIIK